MDNTTNNNNNNNSSSEFLSSTNNNNTNIKRKSDGLAGVSAAAANSSLNKNSLETTSSKPELMSNVDGGGGMRRPQQQKQLSKSSAYLSNSAQSINEESLYLNSGGVGGVGPSQTTDGVTVGQTGPNGKFQQLSNPTLNRVTTSTRPEKLFSASHLNQLKNSSNKNISKILNGGGGEIDSDGSENSLLSNASRNSSQSGPPEFLKSKIKLLLPTYVLLFNLMR